MKALIKIIIGLAVIVACVNATRAAYTDYQFTDDVHQGLLFDSQASEDQVAEMVMRLATQHEIPLAAEDIRIRTIGQELRVEMSYTSNIVLIPGVFAKDWTFSPTTSVRRLAGSAR